MKRAAGSLLLSVPLLIGAVDGRAYAAVQAAAVQAAAVQAAAPAQVEFHFERPGLPIPAYTIVLGAEGEGTYTEAPSAAGVAAPDRRGKDGASEPTPIRVGQATLTRIFAAQSSLGSKPCESRQKNIANTGRKTLAYRGGGVPPASCTFNYSDTPALNDIASAFLALAETMQSGVRLAAKHRFDRLGLDPEMEVLDSQVKAGRALEVGNIAPVLRSIAADDRVIDRVRRRAARLLQEGGVAPEVVVNKADPGISER